jgi:hypothetical protein
MLVAELEGQRCSRIGIMRAVLNHGKPDTAMVPPRKRAKAYRVVG